MPTKISIQATNISVGYERKTIIQDMSFHAQAGKLTVLLGPNGCGKSTLLKALSRVLPLKTGQVNLAELNVHHCNTKQLAKTLAFLPQGPVSPEGLTVKELVAQGRFPYQSLFKQWSKRDAELIDQALKQTQLTELGERALSELSGGQRQRAWIAMVLAQDTPVLMLDEPTAFLDLKVQVELMALLQGIAHQKQRTLVVVLHDLNVAAAFADHLVMMRAGAIVAEGSVDTVFTAENLKSVFDLEVSILQDPDTGRPLCAPRSTAKHSLGFA